MIETWYRFWLGIALSLVLHASLSAKETAQVEVAFYSTTLSFPKVYCSELDLPEEMGREVIVDSYEHFVNCSYKPLLSVLLAYQEQYNLSDWHLYEITARMTEANFADKRFQIMFQWFLLRKAGLDVLLFYNGADLYLHAQCSEAEFGFYTLAQGSHSYINLTAKRDGLLLEQDQAFTPDIVLDGQAVRPFSLRLRYLPEFPQTETIERKLAFKHKGQTYHLAVTLNVDHIRMMDDYPYYNQAQYFEVGFSSQAEHSLLPQLERILEGRSEMEQVELLLSFVRTSFFYKDDRVLGKEKPMTPEQTLYNTYSDCEDRSALFFYLVDHLLQLPAIVVDFEQHVGVAVRLADARGKYFIYKDQRFIYCEATGPDDHLGIGEMWPEVREMKSRILIDNLQD